MQESNESLNNHCGIPVETSDGSYSLRHPDHGELYHSHSGARLEAQTLYVEASGIVQALRAGAALHVLDVGLGLGYNALVTIEAWYAEETPAPLTITSLEVNPALPMALTRGASWEKSWPSLWQTVARSLKQTEDNLFETRLKHPKAPVELNWKIRVGNALDLEPLHLETSSLDYVWQDPFSPTNNPTLWTRDWFAKIARHAHRGTTLMTYSVAGIVRHALEDSGWIFEKIPTPGGKKAWLKATLDETPTSTH